MVRAGVVSHPSKWPFSGYNEIQEPRRKNRLIDYEMLQNLIGSRTYDELRSNHRGWIEGYLRNGVKGRQEEWTESIAIGSMPFVEDMKALLGYRAKGRDVVEIPEGYQLREGAVEYKALFGAEKGDIGLENSHFWDINAE